MLTCDLIMYHVNIIMLHVDIKRSHVNIIISHVDIIYLACRGKKYATKQTFKTYSFHGTKGKSVTLQQFKLKKANQSMM